MSTASNPQIAVITYMEKKILESFAKENYVLVLRQMLNLLSLIRMGHRQPELIDKIKKEYKRLKGQTETKRIRDTLGNSLVYNDWFGEIMETLYIRGYLVDQGYEMTYPSELSPEGVYVSPLLQK